MRWRTKKGYGTFEVMSALQKCIRRGLEREAMYWALELIEGGSPEHAFSRLRVIAHEDIGMGDMQTFTFAIQSLNDLERWYPKNGTWKLALANVILSLCRAIKTRISDHFQAVVYYKWSNGWKLKIPDYALDKHTSKGKRLGRGIDHFMDEGIKLNPEHHDEYEDEARKVWKTKEQNKKKQEVKQNE